MTLPVTRRDPVAEEAWMLDARCRGMGPDLFHPAIGDNAGQAKAVCALCSVRAECLNYALDTYGRYAVGVWGGTTARERRGMRPRKVAA